VIAVETVKKKTSDKASKEKAGSAMDIY